MEKKFVYLEVDEHSSDLLRYWCKINDFNLLVNYDGFPQTEECFKFHLTIFHTENEVEYSNGRYPIFPVELQFDRFEVLGEENDVPVIKVKKTLELQLIRNKFVDLGFKDKWPEWKPHISLSYDRKKYDLNNLSLPKFTLLCKYLTIEKQKE